VALTFALAPTTASAQRQSFSGTFTTTEPATSTGYVLAIDYRDPANPEGKPPAVARVEQILSGIEVNTLAMPRCFAGDAQIETQGESACPPETRVGGGTLSADFGGGSPRVIENRVTVFNANNEFILFTESTNVPGPPIRTSTRIHVDDANWVTEAPPLPAPSPSDPYISIKSVRLTIDAHDEHLRKPYILSPKSCPESGVWTNTANFTYRDGVTESASSTSACDPRPAKPALSVARIVIGNTARRRHGRIRIGLFSDSLVEGVSVRLVRHGKTFATGGLAQLRGRHAAFLEPKRRIRRGRYRVEVSGTDVNGDRAHAARSVRLR
jgi:hypothetical protein